MQRVLMMRHANGGGIKNAIRRRRRMRQANQWVQSMRRQSAKNCDRILSRAPIMSGQEAVNAILKPGCVWYDIATGCAWVNDLEEGVRRIPDRIAATLYPFLNITGSRGFMQRPNIHIGEVPWWLFDAFRQVAHGR